MELVLVKVVFSRILVVRGAVRELWVTYLQHLIEILAYGLMSSTVILWLSSDLGYTDAKAGFVIATWSTFLTLFAIMVGSLTDALGIRKTILFGYLVCLFSRFFMAVTTTKWVALGLGLMPLAFGLALLSPVMNAAIRRFSSTEQRSMAFSLYYALMNVGYAIAGWLFDVLRQRMGEYGQMQLWGAQYSTYRVLFIWSFVFTIIGFLVSFFWLREGVEVTDSGEVIVPRAKKAKKFSVSGVTASMGGTLKNSGQIFASLWKEPNFYKFLGFLALAVGVKLIFYHMHYTFPKYGIRELGEGAPIGRLFSVLNPVMIVFLTPLVGALTQHVSAYRMVTVGSFISAASVFFIAMPAEWFTGLANGFLGNLIAHTWLGISTPTVSPLYVSITLFVALLSIGEALWSPRLYEYTAAIAPKGQEASYMALSSLPYFIAKFFVGMVSGVLLEKYCPAIGARNSGMIWFWVGVMAMVTPVGMLIFSRYIRVHEAGRADNE